MKSYSELIIREKIEIITKESVLYVMSLYPEIYTEFKSVYLK